jgi:hypothetical protein
MGEAFELNYGQTEALAQALVGDRRGFCHRDSWH